MDKEKSQGGGGNKGQCPSGCKMTVQDKVCHTGTGAHYVGRTTRMLRLESGQQEQGSARARQGPPDSTSGTAALPPHSGPDPQKKNFIENKS